ncbi:MAG: hypothetical protein KGJ77_07905 [Acidobacteriota bacterium]|nr:hypothetical protein [Acidobacteriota bacterium]
MATEDVNDGASVVVVVLGGGAGDEVVVARAVPALPPAGLAAGAQPATTARAHAAAPRATLRPAICPLNRRR